MNCWQVSASSRNRTLQRPALDIIERLDMAGKRPLPTAACGYTLLKLRFAPRFQARHQLQYQDNARYFPVSYAPATTEPHAGFLFAGKSASVCPARFGVVVVSVVMTAFLHQGWRTSVRRPEGGRERINTPIASTKCHAQH